MIGESYSPNYLEATLNSIVIFSQSVTTWPQKVHRFLQSWAACVMLANVAQTEAGAMPALLNGHGAKLVLTFREGWMTPQLYQMLGSRRKKVTLCYFSIFAVISALSTFRRCLAEATSCLIRFLSCNSEVVRTTAYCSVAASVEERSERYSNGKGEDWYRCLTNQSPRASSDETVRVDGQCIATNAAGLVALLPPARNVRVQLWVGVAILHVITYFSVFLSDYTSCRLLWHKMFLAVEGV